MPRSYSPAGRVSHYWRRDMCAVRMGRLRSISSHFPSAQPQRSQQCGTLSVTCCGSRSNSSPRINLPARSARSQMDCDQASRKRAGESEGELEQDLRQTTKFQQIEDDGQDTGQPVEGGEESVVDAIMDNCRATRPSSSSLPQQSTIILLPPPPMARQPPGSGEASGSQTGSGAADATREPKPGGPEGMTHPKPGEGPGLVSRGPG